MAMNANGIGGRNRKVHGLNMSPAQNGANTREEGDLPMPSAGAIKMFAFGLGGLIVMALGAVTIVAMGEPSDTEPEVAEARPVKRSAADFMPFKAATTSNLVTIRLPIHRVSAERAERNRRLIAKCSIPQKSASPNHRFPNRPTYPQVRWESGEIITAAGSAAPMLNCLASHERARFCDATERRDLASTLAQYETVIQEHFAFKERQKVVIPLSNRWWENKMLGTDMLGENKTPGETEENHIESWHGEVTAAVRLLAEDGYLSARDFGSNVPGDLADYLVQPKTKSCKP